MKPVTSLVKRCFWFVVLALCATTANAQIQWLDADVGGPTFKGSSVLNGDGTYTIQGGGSDIWNTSSQFHYLYAWASGPNWQVIAQFQSFVGPSQWSKVEIMVDQADTTVGPQGGDPFIAMMDTQPSSYTAPDGSGAGVNDGGVDQWRTAANGNPDWLQVGTTPAPAYPNDWFRVTRQTNVFILDKSPDGINWTNYISIDTSKTTLNGQDNHTHFGTAWPNLVAVGIAVTAHNDTWKDPSTELPAGATAVIGNLSATFPPAVPPTLLAVSQQVRSGVTNVLGGEATLSFAATNNAWPISAAYPVAYQWYKNGTPVANATNGLHTWLLDGSDNTAQYHCHAFLAAPYNGITLDSATATIGVLHGVYYTNGLKIEKFYGAPSRPVVEVGNIGPATQIGVEPNCDDPGGYGNNYVFRVSGWFIAPTTDKYTFYTATDDDSDLFLSTDNTIANKRLIAQETVWMNIDQWLTGGGGAGTASWTQNNSDSWSPDNGATIPWANGIPLNAGQAYYIEDVHYQGGGGDCFSVTYQTATMKLDPNWTTTFTNGTPSLLYASNNVLMYATVPATYLNWVTTPTNTTTTVGFPATFYSLATSDSEFSLKYQWYRGVPPTGTAVSGGTAANLSTAPTVAGDNGATYYVVATTAENEYSITSSVATVNVSLPVLEYGWTKHEYWYNLATVSTAAWIGSSVTNSGTTYITTYLNPNPAVAGADNSIFEPRMEGESASNEAGDNYIERASTLFYPPATGNYVFFDNSDDDSDLFVSTDSTAANAVLVAQEINWSNPWQWQQDEGAAATVPSKCSGTWTDANGNAVWATGIHMNANTPYYVAIIHHEGGGGDNCEATYMNWTDWNNGGQVPPANGSHSLMAGNQIASYVPRCFNMSFTQQPTNPVAVVGGIASFNASGITDSTSAVGDENDPRNEWNNYMFYQWTKNGVAIPGANSSTYSFGPVAPSDSTIAFACTIRALGYTDDSGNPLWKTSSTVNVTVTGTDVFEPGFALHQYWSLNPGRVTIENNGAGDPTWTMASPAFAVGDTGAEVADNFCDDLVGFFVPPTTGSYVFFCNADDDTDLFLSTDSSASSRRLVAQQPGAAGGALQWGTGGVQVRSDTFVDPVTGTTPYASGIPLVAGQKYFMQMVHHQGGGNTYSCATYMLTTDPNLATGPANGTPSAIRLSEVGTYVPKCSYVTITNQPQSVTVNNYASTTFTTGAATDSTLPVGGEGDWRPFFNTFLEYQWYKNNTPVAGATTSAFAMPTVLPTDNNATFKCIMRALGYTDASGNVLWATSQVATLTVNVTAPQLVYSAFYVNSNYVAWTSFATNYIILSFSEPMDPVGLSQMSSYTLPAGLTLLGVTVNSNDYRSVALSFSGTVTLPANVSVSSSLTGLGGGLALSGSTSAAVNAVPLTDIDIGVLDDPAVPAMMYVEGAQAYTIACEGSDIWSTADGFNFAYETKTGDFDVVVRVKDVKHTSNWAKAGLMVRETIDPGVATSRNWNIINDPVASDGIMAPDGSGYGANTIECNCRQTTGAASGGWESGTPWPPAYPNAWVRLTRVGTLLTAYASTNGTSWTLLGSQDPSTVGASNALPALVYVGICTTAHNNDAIPNPSPLIYLDTVDYDNYNSSYVPVETITMGAPVRGVGTITFTWTPTGVGTLYSSPALTGPSEDWTPVTNGTGTAGNITVPIGTGPLFFRVHNP